MNLWWLLAIYAASTRRLPGCVRVRGVQLRANLGRSAAGIRSLVSTLGELAVLALTASTASAASTGLVEGLKEMNPCSSKR